MENAVTTSGSHQEVFERVWQRVMGDREENSPIVVAQPVEPVGDLPCVLLCPQSGEDTPLPALREGPSPHLGCDFPGEDAVLCLGQASACHSGQLQQQVQDALDCWQGYRCLARRAGGGNCSRQLAALAAEKYRAAKRLAAALFLISGIRFWPADRLTPPVIPSYLGAVRTGYRREQQREQAYRMAAADTADTALEELYRELADQSRSHSRTLRSILEQAGF